MNAYLKVLRVLNLASDAMLVSLPECFFNTYNHKFSLECITISEHHHLKAA